MRAQLLIKADGRGVKSARDFVHRFCLRSGCGRGVSSELMIAAAEALSNAAEHGSEEGAPIRVDCRSDGSVVRLRVIDAGRRLPGAPRPRTHRGRGVAIMCALTDQFLMLSSTGGTTIELVRRFAKVPRREVTRREAPTHTAARRVATY